MIDKIKKAHVDSAIEHPSKEYPYMVVKCYRDTLEPYELVVRARTHKDAVTSLEDRILARKGVVADYSIIHEGRHVSFVLFNQRKVG